MYHGNTPLKRFFRVFKADALAVKVYLSLIRRVNAEQTFHKRRFARPVFSHQSVDGPCPYVKRYTVKRLNAWKALAYILHFK
jgi:hypothetical protein